MNRSFFHLELCLVSDIEGFEKPHRQWTTMLIMVSGIRLLYVVKVMCTVSLAIQLIKIENDCVVSEHST